MFYREALRIHGYVGSESDWDSDSGKSEFDSEYYKYQPPPVPLEEMKDFIVIKPIRTSNADTGERKTQQTSRHNWDGSSKCSSNFKEGTVHADVVNRQQPLRITAETNFVELNLEHGWNSKSESARKYDGSKTAVNAIRKNLQTLELNNHNFPAKSQHNVQLVEPQDVPMGVENRDRQASYDLNNLKGTTKKRNFQNFHVDITHKRNSDVNRGSEESNTANLNSHLEKNSLQNLQMAHSNFPENSGAREYWDSVSEEVKHKPTLKKQMVSTKQPRLDIEDKRCNERSKFEQRQKLQIKVKNDSDINTNPINPEYKYRKFPEVSTSFRKGTLELQSEQSFAKPKDPKMPPQTQPERNNSKSTSLVKGRGEITNLSSSTRAENLLNTGYEYDVSDDQDLRCNAPNSTRTNLELIWEPQSFNNQQVIIVCEELSSAQTVPNLDAESGSQEPHKKRNIIEEKRNRFMQVLLCIVAGLRNLFNFFGKAVRGNKRI